MSIDTTNTPFEGEIIRTFVSDYDGVRRIVYARRDSPNLVKSVTSRCNRHSKCVGCLEPGTTHLGEVLTQKTFFYEDGSTDHGYKVVNYTYKEDGKTHKWSEELDATRPS